MDGYGELVVVEDFCHWCWSEVVEDAVDVAEFFEVQDALEAGKWFTSFLKSFVIHIKAQEALK